MNGSQLRLVDRRNKSEPTPRPTSLQIDDTDRSVPVPLDRGGKATKDERRQAGPLATLEENIDKSIDKGKDIAAGQQVQPYHIRWLVSHHAVSVAVAAVIAAEQRMGGVMSPPTDALAFPLPSEVEGGSASSAQVEDNGAADLPLVPPMQLPERIPQAPTVSADPGNQATQGENVNQPEIVPTDIRDHVWLLHKLAEPLAGQGIIIATCFGEDPHQINPETGKPGVSLKPKVIHAIVGDEPQTLEGLARFVKEPHHNIYMPSQSSAPIFLAGLRATNGTWWPALGLSPISMIPRRRCGRNACLYHQITCCEPAPTGFRLFTFSISLNRRNSSSRWPSVSRLMPDATTVHPTSRMFGVSRVH